MALLEKSEVSLEKTVNVACKTPTHYLSYLSLPPSLPPSLPLPQYSVGLIAVKGAISPALYDHCLSEGVIVITSLMSSHAHSLSRVAGTRAVHYISQIRHEVMWTPL